MMQFKVVNTADGSFWGVTYTDRAEAEAYAAVLNENMKPEYRTYKVATITW